MGKNSKVNLNQKAIRELRKQPAIRKDLRKRAERIADAASEGGRVKGYKVTDLYLEDPRAAVSVVATGHALRHDRKHNALVRAMDAGRG